MRTNITFIEGEPDDGADGSVHSGCGGTGVHDGDSLRLALLIASGMLVRTCASKSAEHAPRVGKVHAALEKGVLELESPHVARHVVRLLISKIISLDH